MNTNLHTISQLGYMLAVEKDEVEGKEELFKKNEMELVVRILPLKFMLLLRVTILQNLILQFMSSNLAHYKSAKTRGVCDCVQIPRT